MEVYEAIVQWGEICSLEQCPSEKKTPSFLCPLPKKALIAAAVARHEWTAVIHIYYAGAIM